MFTKNSFSLNDTTYVAVGVNTKNGCDGCAFNVVDCVDYVPSYCSAIARDDRREVIWIAQPQESKEQE